LQQGVKPAKVPWKQGRESRWTVLRTSIERGTPNHGLDWLDARDGLFGEGESEGHGPQQFALDIDRAATHTLQNAGLGQRSATQARQNDGLPWSEILEDPEDLDLEVFDSIALENGSTDPSKAWTDLLDWEKLLIGAKRD